MKTPKTVPTAAFNGPLPPTLPELEAEHETLYRDFLPTLDHYQIMARRALQLQCEIYKRRLQVAFPEALTIDAPLIVSVNAREALPRFNQVMAALEKEKVAVTHVLYDPKTFTFAIYGKP